LLALTFCFIYKKFEKILKNKKTWQNKKCV
jgi:hypothetical protein